MDQHTEHARRRSRARRTDASTRARRDRAAFEAGRQRGRSKRVAPRPGGRAPGAGRARPIVAARNGRGGARPGSQPDASRNAHAGTTRCPRRQATRAPALSRARGDGVARRASCGGLRSRRWVRIGARWPRLRARRRSGLRCARGPGADAPRDRASDARRPGPEHRQHRAPGADRPTPFRARPRACGPGARRAGGHGPAGARSDQDVHLRRPADGSRRSRSRADLAPLCGRAQPAL